MHKRWGIGAVLAVLVALVCAVPAAAAPPANDDFADAETLPLLSPVATANTTEATAETGEPVHGPGGGHSLWYTWEAPSTGWFTADTCESGSLNQVAVYTGSAVNELTRIAASAPEQGFGFCAFRIVERANFKVQAGTVYKIAVDGSEGETGHVRLDVHTTPKPLHDAFDVPQWLYGNYDYEEAENPGATLEAGEPLPAGLGGASVWYAWTAPSNGAATVSTCSSDFDAQITAYAGETVDALTPVGRMVPGGLEECEGRPELRFGTTAGVTYRFALDGKLLPGGYVDSGRIWLRLVHTSGYPQNDSFTSPFGLAIQVGSGQRISDAWTATKELGEPNHAGRPGGASVWYSWKPLESGLAKLDTCGSGVDTLLAVYTGDTVRELTKVAANDDAGNCGAGASALQFDATAGATYRVAVDGAAGKGGEYVLNHSLERHPDRTAPNTLFTRIRVDKRGWAKFHFRSTDPRWMKTRYRCKLDRKPERSCESPVRYGPLSPGPHTFRVTAIDAAGNVDPTPRVKRFNVPRRGTR